MSLVVSKLILESSFHEELMLPKLYYPCLSTLKRSFIMVNMMDGNQVNVLARKEGEVLRTVAILNPLFEARDLLERKIRKKDKRTKRDGFSFFSCSHIRREILI